MLAEEWQDPKSAFTRSLGKHRQKYSSHLLSQNPLMYRNRWLIHLIWFLKIKYIVWLKKIIFTRAEVSYRKVICCISAGITPHYFFQLGNNFWRSDACCGWTLLVQTDSQHVVICLLTDREHLLNTRRTRVFISKQNPAWTKGTGFYFLHLFSLVGVPTTKLSWTEFIRWPLEVSHHASAYIPFSCEIKIIILACYATGLPWLLR